MSRASKEKLYDLHAKVADVLSDALEGAPSHQLLSVAIRFLSDNNVTVDMSEKTNPLELKRKMEIPRLTREELEYDLISNDS